ncbi:MAG: hypothetical protein PHR53_09900, partial [Bacteroidales bacterium]|nr:hypothetical protein [Bacteroidales bacterium]
MMRHLRICFLLLGTFFLCENFSAQTIFPMLPVTDSMSAYYFYNQLDSTNFPRFHSIDTVLSGIEKAKTSRNQYFADLGNLGQAQTPLLFQMSPHTDFIFKTIPYYHSVQNAEHPKFYRSKQPFSELYYHMG